MKTRTGFLLLGAALLSLLALVLVLSGCAGPADVAGSSTVYVKKVDVGERTVTCIIADSSSGTGVDCDWEGAR